MAKKPNPKYFGTKEEVKEILAKHDRGEVLTLDETSKVMGISRSAVRAIELRAMEKLRKALKKYGINDLSDVIDIGRGRSALDPKRIVGSED